MTAVLPRRRGWVIFLSIKQRQGSKISDLYLLILRDLAFLNVIIVMLYYLSLPERGAEASGHVLPQVFTVHGAHEHIHRLYDL